ncbi:MAG: hypothetical protein HC828_01965 [Blastochloris sp.]|nr:hypothetical protein [Blastochloris sp.]
MQNGIGDLYRLPEAFGAPLCDEGDFCAACCERYDRENWIDWMRQRRPHIFTRKERVTDD